MARLQKNSPKTEAHDNGASPSTQPPKNRSFHVSWVLTCVGSHPRGPRQAQSEDSPGRIATRRAPVSDSSCGLDSLHLSCSLLFRDFVRILCMCCSCALKLLWGLFGGPVFGAFPGTMCLRMQTGLVRLGPDVPKPFTKVTLTGQTQDQNPHVWAILVSP